jgi:glycosyltransferase involved in cell wall biosynthesis
MKIAWISDLDFRVSGYFNITTSLCSGLATLGHEIKVVGLGYHGEQHDFPFSVIPVQNFQEATALVANLYNLWHFDVCVVALDIPMQEQFLLAFRGRPFKYVGIMPIEADPLCMSWAGVLLEMDKRLIISEFGVAEAAKMGVSTTYLPVGIDTELWRMPIKEERAALRNSFGFDKNTFAILTVADNQERKNLSKAFEVIGEFAKDRDNVKYMLVTREHCPVGWKLRDMALMYGINNKLMIFERGIGFKELWALYAVSDCFFLSSKTEGLGMPLMEAMAVGVPCVATNATGMKELLSDGRGFLAEYDYTYVDPFGVGNRYFMDKDAAVCQLENVYGHSCQRMINKARKYVENRSWDGAISTLNSSLEDIIKHEPKT